MARKLQVFGNFSIDNSKALCEKLRPLDGNFSAEWELGNIELPNANTLNYQSSNYVIRTKTNCLYPVTAGSTITFTNFDYSETADPKLGVFFSYDGGNTFSFALRNKTDRSPVVMARDALIAIRLRQEEYYLPANMDKIPDITALISVDVKTVSDSINDLKTKMHRPTLTFIDDDGALEALENWESIADEIGVKPTSALITGNIGNGNGAASWDDVARLRNKGFEFISHTHGHIDVTTNAEETCLTDFENSIEALREHGCESRYLVYPYNNINEAKIPMIKKYFSAGIGLVGTHNKLPVYTYWLRRYDICGEKGADGKYAFKDLATLKSYIDTTIIDGGWVIFMTHLRNDDLFYHNEESRQLIIDLCKYATKKGMAIQTFGEAFEQYKNVIEQSTKSVYDDEYYIVDCNGDIHSRGTNV